MTKRKWDIWTFNFPEKGPHPVVLISHPDRYLIYAVSSDELTAKRGRVSAERRRGIRRKLISILGLLEND